MGQKTDFLNKMVAIKKNGYMMEYHPSGGTQQSFVQEGFVPKFPPEREGTPFVGLLNGTPFTYLV